MKALKTILCISALLVLTASTADAYVRRAVGGGWGTGYAGGPVAQPYQASVYGLGGPYTDAPGTCYRDCDNYRKALRESGYDPKNYRTKAGTVKQTAY